LYVSIDQVVWFRRITTSVLASLLGVGRIWCPVDTIRIDAFLVLRVLLHVILDDLGRDTDNVLAFPVFDQVQ
jgi:hypothetical protein